MSVSAYGAWCINPKDKGVYTRVDLHAQADCHLLTSIVRICGIEKDMGVWSLDNINAAKATRYCQQPL